MRMADVALGAVLHQLRGGLETFAFRRPDGLLRGGKACDGLEQIHDA